MKSVDDGRTPDHGLPISSPCEPNGSDELKIYKKKILLKIFNFYNFRKTCILHGRVFVILKKAWGFISLRNCLVYMRLAMIRNYFFYLFLVYFNISLYLFLEFKDKYFVNKQNSTN